MTGRRQRRLRRAAERARRRAERKRTEQLDELLARALAGDQDVVLRCPDGVVGVVAGVGAIVVDRRGPITTIESIVIAGPGAAERRAELEDVIRGAGLGHLVDDARERARWAS